MQILFYSPQQEGSKQDSVGERLQRLDADDTDVVFADDPTQVESALAMRSIQTAFVRCTNHSSEFEGTCRLLASQCRWLVAITDGDQSVNSEAYSLGFHDCITEDCCDETLRSKLSHAKQLDSLEQRLAQAQKLESIGELAAGIAHEINTPIQYVGDNTRFIEEACQDLNAVLAQCQTLIETAESGKDLASATDNLRASMDEADVEYLIEEVPSAIKQTLEGVDRVANIVRAMKEFAHPGVSEMVLTDLSKSIENTVMVARNEWKYVAEMETDFDPNLPSVPCFPGELNQVLLNMIVNAAHAIGDAIGDASETKGVIKISTRLDHSNAEIRIQDSGSGISPENVEKIFNPFFTTKAAGKGTGQGLAIAHSVVVQKHGGTINVESELGQGTTFILQIPLEHNHEPAEADEEPSSGSHLSLATDSQTTLGVQTLSTEGTI